LAFPALPGAYYIHEWQASSGDDKYNAHNFFGTVSVQEYYRDDSAVHQLVFKSGSIKHSRQYANPAKRRFATSY